MIVLIQGDGSVKAFLILLLFPVSWAGPNDPSFVIESPVPYFTQTDGLVKTALPNARLLLISTFAQTAWDPNCSQIGWQFIYQDDSTGQSVRRSFRHISQENGSCSYVGDDDLYFDKNNYPIAGYVYLDGGVSRVKVSFDEAKKSASETIGNGFYPWWAKLATPLHPKGVGRIFWIFEGPVTCNKRAAVSIDVETGLVEPGLSLIPSCP